jgi:hypothetical protein
MKNIVGYLGFVLLSLVIVYDRLKVLMAIFGGR